jgi:hypothetical protein
MPKVTFIEAFIEDPDSERNAGIFVLAAVTPDGRVSEILFPTDRDRTNVVDALGARIGFPPEEVSAARLQEFGFDSSRLI